MIFYINNISIPYTKISWNTHSLPFQKRPGSFMLHPASISFLIDKSEISTILPLIGNEPLYPIISTIIYAYKNKWFMLETSLHHIYEDVHMFPNLFELKFFGKEKEINIEDIRDLKINFLINN